MAKSIPVLPFQFQSAFFRKSIKPYASEADHERVVYDNCDKTFLFLSPLFPTSLYPSDNFYIMPNINSFTSSNKVQSPTDVKAYKTKVSTMARDLSHSDIRICIGTLS
jgi:hypothetical protein